MVICYSSIVPKPGFLIQVSDFIANIQGEKLRLLSERAIFWKKKQMLILSDLHLGKAGHFRKHGIPVSRKIHLSDLQTLEKLIQANKPKQVILLGDLFHSVENNEWNDFLQFLEVYDNVKFTLIEGNHDILLEYPKSMELLPILKMPPFSFTHIRQDSGCYNISGHIHPGVSIRGKGRQSITIPCFHFAASYAVLPAFGQFTGIKKIRPKKGDRVFGIADRSIIELT
ncbi:ligase-associated DNA damage response endonuclease PdeM [Ekhidna sp.]|uniref:ligase-associated DNA damage response endonuclease PdeM n=1 Tax=Ekhidna sp. TaxID=2608089 RepID=UPI0032EC60C6